MATRSRAALLLALLVTLLPLQSRLAESWFLPGQSASKESSSSSSSIQKGADDEIDPTPPSHLSTKSEEKGPRGDLGKEAGKGDLLRGTKSSDSKGNERDNGGIQGESLDRDQNRAPAVGVSNGSKASRDDADYDSDAAYDYGDYDNDYEDGGQDETVSNGSRRNDSSSDPLPKGADAGVEEDKPAGMTSDSTGTHSSGEERRPLPASWSFRGMSSDPLTESNPPDHSTASTDDAGMSPQRRHRHHHHRRQHQEVQRLVEGSQEEHPSSAASRLPPPSRPSSLTPRPEGSVSEPSEEGEVKEAVPSGQEVPNSGPHDSAPSTPRPERWSDGRSRNRNRPVHKPPEAGAWDARGSKSFGEGKSAEEMVRMQSVREQLMKQLRIGEMLPEQVPPLPPLPEDLDVFDGLQDDMGDEEDDEDFMAPKTSQVIIFADDVTSLCKYRQSTGCYYFNQHGRLHGAVTGAELWIYKQRDPNDIYQQRLVVSELESAGRGHGTGKLHARNIALNLVTDVRAGWVKFDVTSVVQRWADKPHKNEGLAVRCKSCRRRNHRVLWGQKEGYRPLLVVHLRPDPPRRHRRSLDCGPGISSCCRQRFFVSFRDLNLPTIIRPDGFFANYCDGSCEGYRAHYNHTLLIQGVRMRSTSVDEATRQALTPCCSPTRMQAVSLVLVEDGALKTTHVPNLSVVACGCM